MTSEFAGKRVMIESPYRNGDRATNLRYLAWCAYDSAQRGELPISSHGNCTQYWPEDDEHREMGFAWRDTYAQTCTLVAYYTDLGTLSEGAQKAKERDKLAGRETTIRSLNVEDKAQFDAGEWPPGTMRKVPATKRLLPEAEDAALRRIRLRFMALYYQAKESPTADAGELLEMQVALDALAAYGKTEPHENLAASERTVRYIRNAVQSYKAGGDAAAAVFAIGLIERILDEGYVSPTLPRDETQDMWVFEDGGDCLGVVEYDGQDKRDEDIGEGERYVRFTDFEEALCAGVPTHIADHRLSMCDDISLIAQEWAEQNPIGQGTSAPSFMRRICDVIGVTYGGDK